MAQHRPEVRTAVTTTHKKTAIKIVPFCNHCLPDREPLVRADFRRPERCDRCRRQTLSGIYAMRDA